MITVIPLTRQKVHEILTYYTASEPPVGAIVSVPLRSKSIHAIVASIQPVESMKTAIRKASFEFKKLGAIKTTRFLPEYFMHSVSKLADYSATTTGAVIKCIVNELILDNSGKIDIPAQNIPGRTSTKAKEVYAVQGNDDDRISSWRSLIRQEFARQKSVVFYLPTVDDAKWLESNLKKGIEEYIFMLNGGLTKKRFVDVWQNIATNEHPIVVMTVGSFGILPRNDIETVIIEREGSRGWISQRSPYLDLRLAIETISINNKQKLYLSDSVLRIETLYRVENGEVMAGSPFKWRSVSPARDIVVNMVKETTDNHSGKEEKPKEFLAVSEQLERLIADNKEENTRMFIYASRRGLASITVCNDCETVVTCNNCSSPVVLHTSKQSGINFFLCHKCGERRSADEKCKKCDGWRLTPLGVGTDRIYKEIKERLPNVEIFRIDADEVKDDKEAEAIIDRFKARPGSVLVGTEMAVSILPEKIDHAVIASVDSLFSLPDFRIPEKINHLIVRLRALSERTVMLQTRRPQEKVFEYAIKGNISDFYRNEIDERKKFNYPPYSTLVKITIEGKKEPIADKMAELKKIIDPYEVDVFPAFTATIKGRSIIHGLVKINGFRRMDHELSMKLKALSPDVAVKVDPESLL